MLKTETKDEELYSILTLELFTIWIFIIAKIDAADLRI
jgi:hypothetical protein